METLKTIEEKLTEPKKEEKNDDKERIDKILEKKQIGRPAGSWDDKRRQHAHWITDGKIKQPKETTLEFYNMFKGTETVFYELGNGILKSIEF